MNFIKKKKLRFFAEPLTESREYLKNPACGWYQIHSFRLEEEVDFEELYWCLGKEERLALLFFDIGAFRDRPLTEEALERLGKLLLFFQEHKKELILRIAYDNQGKGMETEPEFLAEIEGHMKSIAPYLREYAGNILVVQGLFIGSWGEMHDSKFLSGEKLRRLAGTWREALGNEIPMAVRTPSQWRLLQQGEKNKAADSRIPELGLFDDGMFGSRTHLGTYGSKPKEEAAWEEPWCPEDEEQFTGEIAKKVPYGGEALAGEDESGKETPCVAELIGALKKTGVSYLNRVHDAARLQAWRAYICKETDTFFLDEKEKKLWQGMPLYEYIGVHLGYHFVVQQAVYVEKREPFFEITIRNTGFAPCTRALKLELLVDSVCIPVSCDLRELAPADAAAVTVRLPELEPGSYEVFLRMTQEKDGQPVFFGNEPVGEAVLLGRLSG